MGIPTKPKTKWHDKRGLKVGFEKIKKRRKWRARSAHCINHKRIEIEVSILWVETGGGVGLTVLWKINK